MASQEVGNAGPGKASAGGPPASQAESVLVNNSVNQPIDELQNHWKEKLQALGAIQILNGAMILILGVFLGSLQNRYHLFRHFFFVFYTAYPLWGPIFVQKTFEMSITSVAVALAGFVLLSINLAVNKLSFRSCESSQSQDLCIFMGIFSNGLMSLMLILTLLELCISISVSAMCFIESSCNSNKVISFPSNSHSSGMPPDENKSESKEIQA
ncbi:hypothetical protein GH733_007485 [Mirounga leonina]|nr:hypothetical protein GH733_007485 [Mirounga leonina]